MVGRCCDRVVSWVEGDAVMLDVRWEGSSVPMWQGIPEKGEVEVEGRYDFEVKWVL